MWPQTDETLNILADVRDGDDDAVNRLLERHRQSLRRMIDFRMNRQLQRRVDASDIVQDVMLEASRRLSDYLADPKVPFHLWLRQLAKDRIIDMHRRHKVARRRSIDREEPLLGVYADRSSLDLGAMLKDPELTPAAAAIRRELQQRFVDAMESMNEEDREILIMRHQEHLSNSDAAAALNLSQPAAGMRYLRAVRRLRDILREPPSRG